MNILLWVVQILLTALFLFAGGIKLALPIETLSSMGPPNQVHLPGLFLKFIGLCEVLGGLGLVLPGLFRTRQHLTPLAAFLLAIIMVGAVVVSVMGPGVGAAVQPFVALVLCLFVGYGRTKLVPLGVR